MTTEATPNIYQALAAARANFLPIHRNQDGQVGTRHYRYADLATVLAAVEPALTAAGLILVQRTDYTSLETELVLLADPSQIISCSTQLFGEDPQKLGSAITYARRYAIVAMLGLTTEEDDDGAAASGQTRPRPEAPQQAPAAPAPVETPEGWESDEQAQAAHAGLAERIVRLEAGAAEACRAFRQTHGWPLSVEKFGELEDIVRVAEGFAPES